MHVQSQDTLVDIGGYKMHFNIMKGEGTPILFEAGAGNDGAIWNNILDKIHKVTNFWNEELLTMRDNNFDISTIDKPSGNYFLHANYNETMRYARNIHFPENIPILNIFPEISFSGAPEVYTNRWKNLHEDFGDQNDNITNIIAEGSGHYIFQDNPGLIINTIVKAYAETLDEKEQNVLLKKALDNAIDLSIEAKVNNRSEQDLNSLGYSFLGNGELEAALEVFKLATILFPDSFNAYDSYGEALLKVEKKEEAIKMYEKSIELNPENKNGKTVLRQLKEQ